MDGALDGVVAPSGQQISSIDNARVLDGRSVDELPVGTFHLKATPLVLEQQRDGAVVTMLACPNLARVDLEHLLTHSRIVQPMGNISGLCPY